MVIYYISEYGPSTPDDEAADYISETVFYATKEAAFSAWENLTWAAEEKANQRKEEGLERWQIQRTAADTLEAAGVALPVALQNVPLEYVSWYKPPIFYIRELEAIE